MEEDPGTNNGHATPDDFREVYRLSVQRYADLADALEDVVRSVGHLVGMSFTAVTRIDGPREHTLALFDGRRTSTRMPTVGIRKTFSDLVVAARRPITIEDAMADPSLSPRYAVRTRGIRSYIAVPLLLSDGSLYGTLCGFQRRPRTYGEREIELMEMVAGRVVFDIERRIQEDALAQRNDELRGALVRLREANKHRKAEMAMARRIQQELVPLTPPSIAGLSVAARYIALNDVGGDFLDYYSPDHARLGLIIGDASGHGVPAALVASMARIAVDRTRHLFDVPGPLLDVLNGALMNRTRDNFVTACAAIFEPRQNFLRYSLAGHPPPILLRRGAAPAILPAQAGKVLALVETSNRPEHVLEVRPDDFFVFLTDGVLECRQEDGRELSQESLLELLGSINAKSADDLLDQLLGGLTEIVGDRGFEDDATIVVVGVLPSPDPRQSSSH